MTQKTEKRPCREAESETDDEMLLALRPQARGHRWPLEAGKGKETDFFLLKLLEGMWPCWYLGSEIASHL